MSAEQQQVEPSLVVESDNMQTETMNIMNNTAYSARRGIDDADYCRMLGEVKPYNKTITTIAKAFGGSLEQYNGRDITRYSNGILPLGNIEIYKFLKDVTDDLKDITEAEGRKTVNAVHVYKALIRTGYWKLIEDNMDFYSYYPGADYDLITAKEELSFPLN